MTENGKINNLNDGLTRDQYFTRRGRLSQFMIFFNGLILTFTAFATLMIFMDQIQTSKIYTLNEKILSGVQNYFQNASDKMNGIPFYDKSVLLKDEPIYEQLALSFNNLFILSKSESGRWQVNKILENLENEDLNTILKKFKPAEYKSMYRIHYIPVNSDVSQMAAIMRAGTNKYVIGVLKHEHITTLMIENPLLKRLDVFDSNNGVQLFKSIKEKDDISNSYGDLSQIIETLDIGYSNITITTEISKDAYASFISKLPYLILLFGGTLTIIGTLYVRNNQKQSYQLEIMNKALEEKNQTLKDNIEQSKSLHEQLQKKEKDYEIVLNSVQDVFFEMDFKGNVGFINNAWQRMTDYQISDIVDRNIFDFIEKIDSTRIQKLFSDFITEGKNQRIETHIVCADQSLKAVEFLFSSKYENDIKEQRVIGTIRDIQARQKAEHALTEVEKKYRTIVDNVAGGIYQITPDGGIMSGNPALADILGYENVDILIQNKVNMNDCFVSIQDRKQYQSALNKGGFVRNQEAELKNAKGEVIWINENARCVRDIDGTVLYYEGSIEDITEKKAAETALIQEKLNSDLASRAKSEFLANMSHELRTPLNAIIGFSEIIKGEALGTIENTLYVDYAKDIYDSGGRLLNVINEILGISRIEAGERPLNESVVDINETIKTCLNLLASKVENNNLEVNNLLEDDIPQIIAEELAFKQIFMNLFSNAIKFTQADGKITISSDYEEGGELRISITDTGVGIDEADIPKALSPFGQLDNSLSRSNSGTGLGLTLVSSLLRLHRAEFEMISQKNIGTTVTIVIPTKRIAVQKKAKSDDSNKGNITSFRDYKNIN